MTLRGLNLRLLLLKGGLTHMRVCFCWYPQNDGFPLSVLLKPPCDLCVCTILFLMLARPVARHGKMSAASQAFRKFAVRTLGALSCERLPRPDGPLGLSLEPPQKRQRAETNKVLLAIAAGNLTHLYLLLVSFCHSSVCVFPTLHWI